jgi:hypothetical protein
VLLAQPDGLGAQNVRGRLAFDLGPTYNRLEGLPVSVGPIFETIEDAPWRVQALVIIRPDPELANDLDRVGFRARVEKFFARNRTFRLGLAGWSQVQWMEDRGLSNLETSLGTLIFHDDRRDHYEGMGGAAYAVLEPANTPLLFGVEVQAEHHAPIAPGDPASIFDNNLSWRAQPLAADGWQSVVTGAVHVDTRPDDPDGPFNAWWVRAEVTQGVTGDWQFVRADDPDGNPVDRAADVPNDLTMGRLDARRYNTFMNLGIDFRLLVTGALTDSPLPPQWQHAPGGAGTLPGYDLFAIDCGARSTTIVPDRPGIIADFYPHYGCDQIALFQASVSGYLGFRIGRQSQNQFWETGGMDFELIPQWTVFFNAARGWAAEDGVFPRVDSETLYDIGGGITLGDVGVYAAYPLTGTDQDVQIVVRLERRF